MSDQTEVERLKARVLKLEKRLGIERKISIPARTVSIKSEHDRGYFVRTVTRIHTPWGDLEVPNCRLDVDLDTELVLSVEIKQPVPTGSEAK